MSSEPELLILTADKIGVHIIGDYPRFKIPGSAEAAAIGFENLRHGKGNVRQVELQARAVKIFNIVPGDRILLLGDEGQSRALLKESAIFETLIRPFREK